MFLKRLECLKELGPFFFHFFKVIAILVPEESSYFSDHHSEISCPNSFAFGRKLQKLTDFIDMVVTTNILRV